MKNFKKIFTKEDMFKTLSINGKSVLSENSDFDYYKASSWSTREWADFSLVSRTENEIRSRVMLRYIYKCDCACISYICKFSKLSEDFIEELIFTTSPFFDPEYYDLYHQKAVCEIYKHTRSEFSKVSAKLKKDPKLSDLFKARLDNFRTISHDITSFNNKVDWYNIITYQNVSMDFLNKYINNINIDVSGLKAYNLLKVKGYCTE